MGKNIFVIEDDAFIRADICELLTMENYAVSTFANGLEGIHGLAASHQRPDLIILDLMMPVMDGYQFLDAIEKQPGFNAIPVLVLSAEGRSRLCRTRVTQFMKKPIDLEPFLELIQKLT